MPRMTPEQIIAAQAPLRELVEEFRRRATAKKTASAAYEGQMKWGKSIDARAMANAYNDCADALEAKLAENGGA